MKSSGGSRLPPEVFRYSGLGCTFAAVVVLFAAGGLWVDRLAGTIPLFSIVGALTGSVLATFQVWRSLRSLNEDEEQDNG